MPAQKFDYTWDQPPPAQPTQKFDYQWPTDPLPVIPRILPSGLPTSGLSPSAPLAALPFVPFTPPTPAVDPGALPSWYRTEAQEAADRAAATWNKYDPPAPTPAAQAASRTAADASWDRYDPPAPVPPAPPKPTNGADPSWYKPEQPDAPPAASNGAEPSWYVRQDDPRAPDYIPPSTSNASPVGGSAAHNAESAAVDATGYALGAPNMIGHMADSIYAGAVNGASHLAPAWTGIPTTHLTGADFAPYDPLTSMFPGPDYINKNLSYPLQHKIADATGLPRVDPYTPQTRAGAIGHAALGGGLAAAADPFSVVGDGASVMSALANSLKGIARTSAASGVAGAVNSVVPDHPMLAALAAVLTHGGLSAAGSAARAGGGVAADAARQVFSPSAQGEREAARVFSKVDNTAPTIAQPTPVELAGARGTVANATNDIGAGLEPWQAGQNVRDALQSRVTDLQGARTTATAPIMAARDASTASVNLDPVKQLIADKLSTAAGPQRDAISGASQDLMLPPGPAPAYRTQADQLAASRQAINSRISAATRSGDDASAAHLLAIRGALDTAVNASVPEAGQYTQKFADMSRPLDPTEYGPVAKTLDRDQFNSRYTFPDERIPDLFLKGPATRTNLEQLIAAHGGDKDAALGALEEHLAGVAQKAVNPDGTLDAPAFERAMKPYQKSLGGNIGMWFPGLAQKFANARAAQGTLDTLNAQRSLADNVSSGALRDNTGNVTGPSFNRWLASNQAVIEKTQSPNAVMRLKTIGQALQVPQGIMADSLKSEILPAVIGTAAFGAEGGMISALLHHVTSSVFGGVDARRQAAFNAAIEKMTLDPKEAARITKKMGSYGSGLSPTRALVRAIFSTAVATNASTGAQKPQ